MRLAIIDLDGVIANPEARFAKAEEAKQALLKDHMEHPILTGHAQRERDVADIYWRTVFNPDLVQLDALIEGAVDAIQAIEETFQVFYLTSRPESMRQATYEWLFDMQLSGPKIVMKPSAAQYIKTIIWKALTIQILAQLYEVADVLVVDDEPANLNELEKHHASFGLLLTAKSLAEAIAKLNGTWVKPDPFLPEE